MQRFSCDLPESGWSFGAASRPPLTQTHKKELIWSIFALLVGSPNQRPHEMHLIPPEGQGQSVWLQKRLAWSRFTREC